MTWRPKLVALDIDGTLLDHDGNPASGIIEAVGRVIEAGVPVVLATGRGWHSTQPVVERLALPHGVHVCSNGAVIVRHPPFEVRTLRTFDPAPVIRRVAELAPNAAIAVEVIGVGYRLNKPFPEGDLSGDIRIETIDELCAEPASRVVIRDPEAAWADFEQLADRIGMHGVSYAIGWSTWLDIAPEGVNKASALQQITDEAGIASSDVLALGDGRNDLEMLAWAGRGVAMGNAPDEVKTIADDVTADIADGGSVRELDRFFA